MQQIRRSMGNLPLVPGANPLLLRFASGQPDTPWATKPLSRQLELERMQKAHEDERRRQQQLQAEEVQEESLQAEVQRVEAAAAASPQTQEAPEELLQEALLGTEEVLEGAENAEEAAETLAQMNSSAESGMFMAVRLPSYAHTTVVPLSASVTGLSAQLDIVLPPFLQQRIASAERAGDSVGRGE